MAGLVLEGLTKILGGRVIIDNLSMEVKSGEMVCLLGPSGSGKTTTLRMIGGFIPVDAGRILIDGHDVAQVPPERRPTAMVFQQYALWPHMDVYKNIAFGLKLRKLPKIIIREKVMGVLKMVGLEEFQKSYPGQLSGGQQQRVALARALVLEPQLLLLDEPLSNLDAKLRVKVRDDIRDIQQRAGITTVFVTHDQDEALSISDRVAVLSDGRIEQFDSPQELYQWPKTRFVANFIGTMNLFRGRVAENGVYLNTSGGEGVVEIPAVTADANSTAGNSIFVPCEHEAVNVLGDVDIAIRPEDVRIMGDVTGDGPTASVARRIPRGHYDELLLTAEYGELRSFIPAAMYVGESVHYTFSKVHVYKNLKLIQDDNRDTQRAPHATEPQLVQQVHVAAVTTTAESTQQIG